MKTLKFLTILCAVTLFSLGFTNPNPPVYWSESIPYSDIALCGTEKVEGWIYLNGMTLENGKTQVKMYVSLFGESGAHYESTEIDNLNFRNNPNGGWVGTGTSTWHLTKDNVPVAIQHFNWRLYINPDGSDTPEYFNVHFRCI